MRTKELAKFILLRESLREAKEAKKPWNKDPILATYRFCNVHREDDKVTRWIADNWRAPYEDEPDLWFDMVVARLFNLPSTLSEISMPHQWFGAARLRNKIRKLLQIKRQSSPVFNGAYIVSTNGVAMDKVDYLFVRVLEPLWAARKELRPHIGDTLRAYHAELIKFDGLGSFMAAQVVADLKYVAPLNKASDWGTWAASGPGSRRGLNRVMENLVEAPWKESLWLNQLTVLHAALLPKLPFQLHAQDLQNCLCEFDKYERVRLGEGRPKQLYKRSI